MPFTFDGVLDNDLLTLVCGDVSSGTFKFRVGTLKTVITINLSSPTDSDRTTFRRSHAIKTPSQAGPYLPSLDFADYPAYALHRAITSITDYYKQAEEDGHTPTEDWLVPLPNGLAPNID